MHQNVRFVLADRQRGSILSLDYREASVATNSTQVRTCRNDLIPPRKNSVGVFLTSKKLKNRLEVCERHLKTSTEF